MLLSKLTEPCAQVGVKMDVAATYDLANVLWDQGEMTTSIRMLQPLVDQPDIQAQTVAINRPEILANLVRFETYAVRSDEADRTISRVTISQRRDWKSRT
jgi:hypothetical protein